MTATAPDPMDVAAPVALVVSVAVRTDGQFTLQVQGNPSMSDHALMDTAATALLHAGAGIRTGQLLVMPRRLVSLPILAAAATTTQPAPAAPPAAHEPRERAVQCSFCHKSTWAFHAICDDCALVVPGPACGVCHQTGGA